MPFYDQPKNKGRRPNPARGTWEEEGSRYSDAPRRRFGPDAEDDSPYRSPRGPRRPRPEGFGPRSGEHRQGGYAGPSDRRPGSGRSAHGEDSRRSYGDSRTRDFRDNRDNRDNRSGRSDHSDRYSRNDRDDRFRRPRPETGVENDKPQKSYLDFEHVAEPAPVRPAVNEAPENLLSGRNPIREALKSGRDIEKLLVARGELSGSARQIVQMAKEAHVPVQEVEKTRLDEITPHHQGMVAFVSAYSYSTVEDMLDDAAAKGEDPFLVILDGVTDPQNLGAVIRSAECVGAHGVIVRERRGVGLTPAAVKASAGAIEHMRVARVTNLNREIEELKKRGVWVYAVTMDGEDYEKVDFRGGVALVIGSEGEGISRLTLEKCDHRVSLPMKGVIDSLNASVAAGVVMYRVLSSRRS